MIRICENDRVFVLTGAGVSAESGLPTFRGMNGLWRQFRVEELASPEAWQRDPALVWEFYSWRREVHRGVKPNPAHLALAELEKRLGERLYLCTQNVDRLHEEGGSTRVVHMHGELFKSRCERAACATEPFSDERSYHSLEEIAECGCGGKIRPHIVWFGEMPFFLEEIAGALRACTHFLCVGSSGVVYPAAGFVQMVRGRAKTFYVGPEEPANLGAFDQCFFGKAGEVLPGFFEIE